MQFAIVGLLLQFVISKHIPYGATNLRLFLHCRRQTLVHFVVADRVP